MNERKLEDMTKKELIKLCGWQRSTISKLRYINFRHMEALVQYMDKHREKFSTSLG